MDIYLGGNAVIATLVFLVSIDGYQNNSSTVTVSMIKESTKTSKKHMLRNVISPSTFSKFHV
jgi:hypothetical protein